MIGNAMDYCSGEVDKQYRELERRVRKEEAKWEDDHLDGMIIQFLYARSFSRSISPIK
ncbi:MAG: hypothetical protein IPL65_12940 [Lewinellaceae bacterium]|nr:hypothetical protein [Lewinellaceae bacterium]